jgi:hypothetical protein
LFPHDEFFIWQAGEEGAAEKAKADTIVTYVKNKIEQSDFRITMSQLVLDYIDYGNAFAEVVYVTETHIDPEGKVIPTYTGPRVERISPFDIVFDVTASNFVDAPKITRKLISMGELVALVEDSPDAQWARPFLKEMQYIRSMTAAYRGESSKVKRLGFNMDGFSDPESYYNSGLVEILEFEGTLYEAETQKLYKNYRIIVADRTHVLLKEPTKSWLGKTNKVHVGWRERPDNLMAMGPLDNLVGMQYRIDHLENLKADVFDQIAHPVTYQRGYIEDWQWGPGEKIFGDTDSEIIVLRPDTTALNADLQIQLLEAAMEEYAGAPRQAMGIRTPGEKTAFEVASLDNASGRIFQNKTQHFEAVFEEKILNQFLEAGRRNMLEPEILRSEDPDLGVLEFQTITMEDIQAKGKLVPRGARHFARQNQLVQNLNGFVSSAAYADPSVQIHVSGYQLAKTFEELLGAKKFGLVVENVRVGENTKTQRLIQSAGKQVQEEAMVDPALEAVDQDLDAIEDQSEGEI